MSVLNHLAFVLVTDKQTQEEDIYEGDRHPLVTKSKYPIAVNESHERLIKLIPDLAKSARTRVRLVKGCDFHALSGVEEAALWLPTAHKRMRIAIAFLEPVKPLARIIYRDKPSELPLIPLIMGNQVDVMAHKRLSFIPNNAVPVLMTVQTIFEEDGRS